MDYLVFSLIRFQCGLVIVSLRCQDELDAHTCRLHESLLYHINIQSVNVHIDKNKLNILVSSNKTKLLGWIINWV